MKTKILGLFLLLILLMPGITRAQDFINLTPKPKSMVAGQGELQLPEAFGISAEGLSPEMKAEADKFVEAFNKATGYQAFVTDQAENALVKIALNERLAEEGYTLKVTTEGVEVKASTPAGLYFAFQTVKKVLPANVMAGVKDPKVGKYALPVVTIVDEPRFAYRGFMLDVSRHFFTVEDVKRMLEVMSYYKMNNFHWHLSDDQGWRVEIKRYPKLTEVGSIAPNSIVTDMDLKVQYWLNKPYGPYFYTQEQIREVVDYAKERHINIVPEIDMPGHFVAAMAAYPEFSCNPDGSHNVWSNGGISSDVLNVANPQAVQFAKNILEEIMELFPDAPYINIGGDECPTSAWEGNAQCQALYNELGLTSYHQLQSRYMNEIGQFIRSKGHQVAMWNEVITAGSADTKSVAEVDPVIYCWTGADAAANKAADLRLKSIYTPQVPYYINRTQRAGDPPGAGYNVDDVQKVYNWGHPVNDKIGSAKEKYYIGVQGTFWAEHVSDRKYLEWLALPRLIAVAEAGWTQKNARSFEDFQKRMTADGKLLDYNNYQYTRYYFLDEEEQGTVYPKPSTAENKYYYRLTTRATADNTRKGSCIELLRDGSPLIGQYGDKGAQACRLWSNAPVTDPESTDADWQLWAFEEDPTNANKYALVCKAMPEGSVNATPTANGTSGRWNYDTDKKNYNFILGDNGYGEVDGTYYYSIRSDRTESLWMNAAQGGQGYAVNCYGNPSDGNGGLWLCTPVDGGEQEPSGYPAFATMEAGKHFIFTNNVEGFENIRIADDGKNTNLTHSLSDWASNVWTVTQVTVNEDNSQTVQLQNLQTKRFIGSPAANVNGRVGFPVSISTEAKDVVIYKNATEGDFTLSVNDKNIFPLPYASPVLPGVISSGIDANTNAVRPMGAAWNITEVRPMTYICKDGNGNDLGTFLRGIATDADPGDFAPVIDNHALKAIEVEDNTANVTYERNAYTVTIECRDARGALISVDHNKVSLGESTRIDFADVPYYTYENATIENGTTLTPDRDTVVTATYTTEAYSGVKAVGQPVNKVEAGHSYLIYDNSDADNGGRKGFRKVKAGDFTVNRSTSIEGADPFHTWTLEGTRRFKVKNEYTGKYVPQLSTQNVPVTVSDKGDNFSFSLNADGSWKIQGSNQVCWDGVANGNLVGWNAPGHPYIIYEYFVEPYFEVELESVDTQGNVLANEKKLVKAGTDYTPMANTIAGYDLKEIQGSDKLACVDANIKVTILYVATGIHNIEAESNTKNAIYDLSGRKLNKVSKSGVYIVGGRKMLVK